MAKPVTIIIIVLLLTFDLRVNAQRGIISAEYSGTIDSLLQANKVSKNDSSKVNTLNKLSDAYYRSSIYPEAIKYAELALILAEAIKYKKGAANAHNNLGIAFYSESNYSKAMGHYLKALSLNEAIGYKDGVANNLIGIANTYHSQGNYNSALDYYFKAMKLSEAIKNESAVATILGNIGLIYYRESNNAKAIEFYTRALTMDIKLKNKTGVARHLSNIGIVYWMSGNFSKAMENYVMALKLHEELGNKKGIASNLGNIGNVYNNRGDSARTKETTSYTSDEQYAKALSYYLKAVKIHEELQNKAGVALWLGNIGELYTKVPYLIKKGDSKKGYEAAENYLLRALALSADIGSLELQKDHQKALSDLYFKTGRHQLALEHFKKFHALNDSIFSREKSKQIAQMNALYESEQKDKMLIQKEAEVQKTEIEKKNLSLITIISSALVVLLLFSVFFTLYTNRKIKGINRVLITQAIEIKNKSQEINKQAVQIGRYQGQMNPHFIFNAINSLHSLVLKEDKLQATRQIHSLAQLMRATLNNSDKEYITIQAEENYLNQYVQFELQRFEKKFAFRFLTDQCIDTNKAQIPTMILQPFVENAIKHAGLNEITNGEIIVSIEKDSQLPEKLLRIKIRDNGNGMKMNNGSSANKPHQSKGMSITKKRIEFELEKSKMEIPEYLKIKSLNSEAGTLAIPIGTEIDLLVPYYQS